MSDDIYDDVIRNESEEMKTERMEMIVEIYESAECVRDHDFRTETNTHQPFQRKGSDCVKIRSSRSAAVCWCWVLVCVLLLTAVIVLCVHIHTKSTNYTQETHQLLTNITNLTEERDQLLTNITNLTQERDGLKIKTKNMTNERDQLFTNITNFTDERDELKIKNENLTKERDQLLTNITNLTQERDRLLSKLLSFAGCTYYQSSLYFISSEEKNWTESRRYCTERGADLIIINNREEQEFVIKMSGGTRVWIGLTDSDVEDTWKWVDDRTLTSGFWATGEPGGQKAENCALLYSSSSEWHDYPCNDAFKWICEKNIKQ